MWSSKHSLAWLAPPEQARLSPTPPHSARQRTRSPQPRAQWSLPPALVVQQAQLGVDGAAARHDACDAPRREGDVAQQHARVDGPVVDALRHKQGARGCGGWGDGGAQACVSARPRGWSISQRRGKEGRACHVPRERGHIECARACCRRPRLVGMLIRSDQITPHHDDLSSTCLLRLLYEGLPEQLPRDLGHVAARLLQGLMSRRSGVTRTGSVHVSG